MEYGMPAVGDSARGIEGNPVLRLLELQASRRRGLLQDLATRPMLVAWKDRQISEAVRVNRKK